MHRFTTRLAGALRAIVFRRRAERELDEELRAWLETAVEDRMRAGMSRDEALRAARLALGAPEAVKDAVRDVGWESRLDGLVRDARYAVRTLRQAPGFTAVAVITLALGIGANTAVYSAIDAAFFRPLPFPEPDRIVHMRFNDVQVPLAVDTAAVSVPRVHVTDLYDARDAFAFSAAYATGGLNLGSGPEPRRVAVTFVTTEFFQVLGRQPQLGRTFTPAETSAGGPDVAVLSHGLWQSHFGGDPSIVGRAVQLDDSPFVVVGVMPRDFRFPVEADLWVPLSLPAPAFARNAFRNFFPGMVVARLTPGVTLDAAAARLDAMRRPWVEAQLSRGSRIPITPASDLLTPLQRYLAGDRDTTLALTVLMASAGLVLLIACANVATLLLSRAASRQFEITTHAVLGATRARIVCRLLTESLLLALLGATLGLGLAAVAVPILASLIPQDLAGLAPVRIDLRVLLFTTGVATAVGIGFGLWPALGVSRSPLEQLQTSGARTVAPHVRVNRVFVVAQVALACLLVIGAGLMLSTLRSLLGHDLGMRPDLVAAAQLTLPSERYREPERRSGFVRSALEVLQDARGVHAAAAINTLPFFTGGSVSIQFTVEDADPLPESFSPLLVVSPGYFGTVGIPLLSGRDFAWTDSRDAPVAIVNRTLAQMAWPGEDPIGRRIQYLVETPRTVVGLIEDARIAGAGTDVGPQIYVPIQESPQWYVSIVARGATPADVPAVLAQIRTAVTRADPAIPVYDTQSLAAVAGAILASRRTSTLLISSFGILALGLATLGVYGLLAYAVARRTRELGIRMALGAQPGDVLRSIMREGLALAGIGLALGVGAALASTRYMEGMLYGITPRDPSTFAGVGLLVLAMAAVACYVPGRRATRVDPMTALRTE